MISTEAPHRPSGQALLNRDREISGHIVIHEKGQPDAGFDLKRDN